MEIIISILELLLLAVITGVVIGAGMALICATAVFIYALITMQLPMDISSLTECIKKLFRKIKRKIGINRKSTLTKAVKSIDGTKQYININNYNTLLQSGKNSLIVNSIKVKFWDLYSNIISQSIKEQKSIIIISARSFPVTWEIIDEAKEKGILPIINPSYRDIQDLRNDKSYLLLLTYNYDKPEDFTTALEYGYVVSEKLIKKGDKVLFFTDEIENFYKSPDCKEVYESELKNSLDSEATIICLTDGVKKNDINKEFLKSFNYIIRLNDYDDALPEFDIEYIADCVYGDKADIFLDNINKFEELEKKPDLPKSKLYDTEAMNCSLFEEN